MAQKVCIIGAGAAGLGSALAMLDAGFDFDIYESRDRVGGHWNDGYDILHLITSRDATGYPGLPMPQHYPVFPSRAQVLEYLREVASDPRIQRRIRFNQPVEEVTKTPAGTWTVTTPDFQQEYESVLVATGHLRTPRFPELAERFTGNSVHSRHYRNTSGMKGHSVLVVGSGNSGCDIAVDCAQNLLDTDICIRTPHKFVPKTFFGTPITDPQDWHNLPPQERAETGRLYRRVVLGDNENYPGLLPFDEAAPEEDIPTVANSSLLYWIQHGRIAVKPGIADIDGNEVVFSNGASKRYDSIIWATGYDIEVPGVAGVLAWENGVPLTYGYSIFPEGSDEELDGLYLIGFTTPRGLGQIRIYPREATIAARAMELRKRGLPVRELVREVTTASARVETLATTWESAISAVESLLAELEDSASDQRLAAGVDKAKPA
jgi:cation diffusion facilitator CzcD-associated flavoprotein CzcO